jgi:hypothetical protein
MAGLLWRWALTALLLVGVGAASAQSIESVLAPGVVSQAHAKTEHDCKACHMRFDRTAQDGLCLACHKDVGEDMRLRMGLHGKREPKQQCRACHTEHKGRDAALAAFDARSFDHRITDFALLDKHTALECNQCHRPGKRWREAPGSCAACHTKDDVHKGGLGQQCADCHTAKGWKPAAAFDHDTRTRFALSGKHAEARCESCHEGGRYKETPRACIGCHRKDDSHKGQYGEKCETCHGAKAWKPSTFNHDTETRYPLKERHRAVKCASCHTGALYGHKTGTACVDCHLKDDTHKASLGTKCGECHTERGWKEPLGFDHAKSRFPLLGKHQQTTCKACHADAQYRQTPSTCIACHRKDDRHQGSLGENCADCHGEQSWKPPPGRFDHSRTRFPLKHAHAAPTVRCSDCHESQRSFRGTPMTCVACHQRDDRHEGTLGERCDSCHSDVNWRVERFDHARTRYPLAGRHLVTACSACHKSLRYREAPRDCTGCHAKDDRHKAALGVQCQSCHNVRAWSLWEFDHDRQTKYRLEGRHRTLRCETCHQKPAPPGGRIAEVTGDCHACHRKDDAHEGRFGRRCETCHTASSWRQLRQATAPR